MKSRFFRSAAILASAASLSLVASPALAGDRWGGWNGWGGHRDRVDAGDVLAGILIIGGIAAVASAASKSGKNRRYDDRRYEDRRDGDTRDYRGDDYRNDDYRQGSSPQARGGSASRDTRDLNGAVDRCVSEIERGAARVESVDRAERDDNGWKVEGRVGGDDRFACTVDQDGRIRQVSIAGRAI
ncbi:hypothetical protein [Novosphingobium sp.]|uniref:hypothetical protein n=1 Tax=Novosphingobium sp. TaxID=1874826 RepID=UPI0025F67FB9|nr:hypothetical protein [Novosphingobium sp.]